MQRWIIGALVLTLAATVHAGSIAFHIVGTEANNSTLKPDDTAGQSDVAQAHWTNVHVNSDDDRGKANQGRQTNLMNNEGKTIKGCNVIITSGKDGLIWPGQPGKGWGFNGGDQTLINGYVQPKGKLAIQGIPYKQYDIYVYLAAGANGGTGSVTLSLAPNVKGAIDKNATYFYRYTWLEGLFVKSEATTKEMAAEKGSNYIQFTGNTAHSINLDFDGKISGSWTGVAGVQIVDTTPPPPEKPAAPEKPAKPTPATKPAKP